MICYGLYRDWSQTHDQEDAVMYNNNKVKLKSLKQVQNFWRWTNWQEKQGQEAEGLEGQGRQAGENTGCQPTEKRQIQRTKINGTKTGKYYLVVVL